MAEFRYQIRRFLHFSESTARAHGLEPQQHQLLLAIKGLPEGLRPTVRHIAERMLIEHHSAVELISRLAQRGAVTRTRGEEDRREVLVQLTPLGEAVLRDLSVSHYDDLQTAASSLIQALTRIQPNNENE